MTRNSVSATIFQPQGENQNLELLWVRVQTPATVVLIGALCQTTQADLRNKMLAWLRWIIHRGIHTGWARSPDSPWWGFQPIGCEGSLHPICPCTLGQSSYSGWQYIGYAMCSMPALYYIKVVSSTINTDSNRRKDFHKFGWSEEEFREKSSENNSPTSMPIFFQPSGMWYLLYTGYFGPTGVLRWNLQPNAIMAGLILHCSRGHDNIEEPTVYDTLY